MMSAVNGAMLPREAFCQLGSRSSTLVCRLSSLDGRSPSSPPPTATVVPLRNHQRRGATNQDPFTALTTPERLTWGAQKEEAWGSDLAGRGQGYDASAPFSGRGVRSAGATKNPHKKSHHQQTPTARFGGFSAKGEKGDNTRGVFFSSINRATRGSYLSPLLRKSAHDIWWLLLEGGRRQGKAFHAHTC